MDNNTFIQLLNKLDVNATESMVAQFNKYYELLVEWNSFMNLTGITEYDEVLVKHFADSVAIKKAIDEVSKEDKDVAETLNMSTNISIIDVGTGAGFPGLPLKIVFPETNVYLLDSLNKRVKFLNEVIKEIASTTGTIEAAHGRAEDVAKNPDYRQKFDLGVSRAVANLATLSEYVLPFVKKDGYFVAYKSGDIDEELNQAKKAIYILGGEIRHVYKFTLPDTDIERSFVFIKKISDTPKKYPRKSGLPSKEPIG